MCYPTEFIRVWSRLALLPTTKQSAVRLRVCEFIGLKPVGATDFVSDFRPEGAENQISSQTLRRRPSTPVDPPEADRVPLTQPSCWSQGALSASHAMSFFPPWVTRSRSGLPAGSGRPLWGADWWEGGPTRRHLNLIYVAVASPEIDFQSGVACRNDSANILDQRP